MRNLTFIIPLILIIGFSTLSFYPKKAPAIDESRILSHIVNPTQKTIAFYWKDKAGKNYKNFKTLKTAIEAEGQELVFAMNGGMYMKNLAPQGLYIECGVTLSKLNKTQNAYGNFYLQPNGIFYLTDEGKAVVCKTADFIPHPNIQYATQSGPMLVIDGNIHPKFTEGSKNVHIRNGVGVLPDGNLLFAMSKEKINLYDFATYFQQKGCKNALYLDGFVSKTYLPSQNWVQWGGNFGVIIGEVR